MRILGAIIAGGGSQRFGGDKAAAVLGGRPLIEHVRTGLSPQVDAIVVCGRDWPGMVSIADQPAPGMGPLGGLCAALRHAADNGFDAVLTAGCDILPVPDFSALVEPTAAVFKGQHLLGFWPVEFAARLEDHLAGETDRSLRHWITVTGAKAVACETEFHNLNTREDFALYSATQGLAA